jgi:hypothetical protein
MIAGLPKVSTRTITAWTAHALSAGRKTLRWLHQAQIPFSHGGYGRTGEGSSGQADGVAMRFSLLHVLSPLAPGPELRGRTAIGRRTIALLIPFVAH